MKILTFALFLVLGVLAARRAQWAYASFVILGLLYFPASVGFRVDPEPCELIFDGPLAIQSLTNVGHIVAFFLFFLLTLRQFRHSGRGALLWSAALTMAMGAAVEIAQGLSGAHHCKSVDLIPDLAGMLLGLAVAAGAAIAATWSGRGERSRR